MCVLVVISLNSQVWSLTYYASRQTCVVIITVLPWAVRMATACSVISVQFKNKDENDDVAPPSQHSASGSAESSSDSCLTNALSFHPKKYISNTFRNCDYFHNVFFMITIQNLILKCLLLLEVLLWIQSAIDLQRSRWRGYRNLFQPLILTGLTSCSDMCTAHGIQPRQAT